MSNPCLHYFLIIIDQKLILSYVPAPKKRQSYESLMTVKHSPDWDFFVKNYRHLFNFNIFTCTHKNPY